MINHLTWGSSVQRSDSGPLSGTLLASLVQNLGDDGLAIIVLEFKNVGSDVDEERVKNTLVPLQDDIGNLVFFQTKTTFEDIVGFRDELHVTVLDT